MVVKHSVGELGSIAVDDMFAQKFTDIHGARFTLRRIFDRRELWESRDQRKRSFRNGDWYTMGSSLYLDLHSAEGHSEYVARVDYWNEMLVAHFPQVYRRLQVIGRQILDREVLFLADEFPVKVGIPGFHIFPPNETFGHFFGKHHRDLQWSTLFQLPGFKDSIDPNNVDSHFSFTVPLLSPLEGSKLLIGSREANTSFKYTDRFMYVHSGQFEHAIAPFENPVLPTDWRITLQGHGFFFGNKAYIYW